MAARFEVQCAAAKVGLLRGDKEQTYSFIHLLYTTLYNVNSEVQGEL